MTPQPHLLAAEAGIVQALQRATQQGADAWCRKIGTRDYLATVAEEMQDAPALYVVFDGLVIFDADEQRANLGYRWLVVVAVKTAAQPREAAPRNDEGGRYMAAVHVALHGLLLPAHTHGLVPTTPPRPYYSPGGSFAYYPLAFIARAHFSKRFGFAGAAITD
ncbi:MAG: hypothetical protein IAE86_06530 [Burkholderiaceae bacterium]|nr:hypothetical protein [Burkholderiaceae bacterium]